jgi:branched-chain amino acid transport system substrate-binding protein
MRIATTTLCGVAAAALMAVSAHAAGTVKIGLIIPYSGQFADTGKQMDNAIKLYMKQHGDMVAGKKIEIIRKDVGGINPPVAKRLAQELITRDHVDILAGFALTPNAMAAGDVSKAGKKFMVVMNAATSSITKKSPYLARTSLTIPQLQYSFGKWAEKNGVKNVYTMVANYGPGIDAETWFKKGFEAAGGKIAGSVRMPVRNSDFSSYVQKAKDTNPGGIFVFIPGGTQPAAFAKALRDRGMDPQHMKILAQGELTFDESLKSVGDSALGIITVFHYDWTHKSAKNKAFVAAYEKEFNRHPDIYSIGGYDGMHLIYAALRKTKGDTSGAKLIAAAKGMHWESPRGPISIDPKTRDIIQNVYIRKVEKVNGHLENVEIATIKHVKDPAK